MLLLFAVHAGILLVMIANAVYLWRGKRAGETPLAAFPKVSVLIPARNEEVNLGRLLPTLFAQTYPDFEVIVYDDGSEDGTGRVLASFAGDPRLTALRGEGPPVGWVGKVHALYQATRHATGDRFLFLDADAELTDAGALGRLVGYHEALPPGSVMTGLTHLVGGGLLLVSLVPTAILGGLPWPLVRPAKTPSLGALNGQCWMIDSAHYRRLEPHLNRPAEVLEDVKIGRYLIDHGLVPALRDVQGEVRIHMYRDLADAWQGFRKNAYLIMGGTLPRFLFFFVFFALVYVLAPLFGWGLLASVYGLKLVSDRLSRFPLWLTLLAPLSFLLGAVLQLDSARAHLTGTVSWKGRRVGTPPPASPAA